MRARCFALVRGTCKCIDEEVCRHGFLAACGKPAWENYLATVGLHGKLGRLTMRLIGCMDIAIAFITLLAPHTAVTTWAALWAFSTALIRPLSGEELMAFVERAGNWATPLALLWSQLQASGRAHPLVSQLLTLVPVPMPFPTNTPFLQHMAATLVVFVVGFVGAFVLRVLRGNAKTHLD